MLVDPKVRNPLVTTTYGTGELIKAALNKGVSTIIIELVEVQLLMVVLVWLKL